LRGPDRPPRTARADATGLDRLPARRGLASDIALGVTGGLLLAQLLSALGGRLRGLLGVLLVSLFLSFAVEPAVQWMARRGIRRGAGTGIVFLGVLLGVAGMIAAVVPLVVAQVENLAAAGPSLLDGLADRAASLLPGGAGAQVEAWLTEQAAELPGRLPELAGGLAGGVIGLGQTVLGGVFQTLTAALIVFYLVADGPALRASVTRRLSPRDQVRVLGLWELAISKTGGYVYSRLLTAVVSATFHVLAFSAIGLEYPVALGLFVGVVSAIVPTVGTYIAGALPIVVALADSTPQAVVVLAVIVVYQQIENYLIVPRITASTLELHPAVAFVSVIAGAAVGGATGALLALPAVAIVAALLSSAAEDDAVLERILIDTGRPDAVALVEASGHPPPRRRRSRDEPRVEDPDADVRGTDTDGGRPTG
jgi:predicted PurR-regulated permease PerM